MWGTDLAGAPRGDAGGPLLHQLRLEALNSTLAFLVVLVPSVILHEVSHGVVALAFGDDTAKRAGRLSLNPLRHVDPFGTVLLPALLAISGAPVFGFAKPVPVNVGRLRNPRQQAVLVSLAGPATNIVLALLAAFGLRAFFGVARVPGFGLVGHRGAGTQLLLAFGIVNVVLASFNLIPVPPLDGSAVIERLLPAALWPRYLRLRQYSMGLLLVVVLLLRGRGLDLVFRPALDLWQRLL